MIFRQDLDTSFVPSPRMGHTAVSLSDGRIIVHGGTGMSSSFNDTLLVLDTQSSPWHWLKPNLTRASLPNPNRAWHTATLVEDDIVVYAYGLDTATKQTSDKLFFLIENKVGEWTWSQSNPLATQLKGLVGAVAGSGNGENGLAAPHSKSVTADSAIISPDVQAVIQAAQHFLNNTSARVVNPKATEVEASSSVGNANSNKGATNTYSLVVHRSSTASVSSNKAPTSIVAMPSSTDFSVASSSTALLSSSDDLGSTSDSSTAHSKVIAGAVSTIVVLAAAAGLAGLYFRRKAAATEDAIRQKEEPREGVPPISELLYTRKVPRRMLSLGSTLSARTGPGFNHRIGSVVSAVNPEAFGQIGENDEDDPFNPRSETINEFGGLTSPSSLPKSDLPMPVMSHTSTSLTSNRSQTSVASYPFLTSFPIHAIHSQQSAEALKNDNNHYSNGISSGGNGVTRILLRSHTMSSASSKSSYKSGNTPDAISSLSGSRVENLAASTPPPSRGFVLNSEEGLDPFADFEEVSPCYPSCKELSQFITLFSSLID